MCEPDPLCFVCFGQLRFHFGPSVCCCYMCIYNLLSCRYLFVVCPPLFCFIFVVPFIILSSDAAIPLPPLTSSLLPEGRRRRRGGGCGGGVPPCQRVRLGALHCRAAIQPPAYRGASKPQKMHTEKPKAGRRRFTFLAKLQKLKWTQLQHLH